MGGIPAMEMEYRIQNVFIYMKKGEDSISKIEWFDSALLFYSYQCLNNTLF